MPHNTPKHFVLQLGSLVSLYVSLSFLLVLLFGIINIRFPDEVFDSYAFDSAANGIRLSIAMVIVFMPTYLILTRLVNQLRREEPTGMYLTLTKWLIYLSLLIGGGILLGDLVAVIMTFLQGEITQRFLFKALAVLVVVGVAFYYYLLDARGAWLNAEAKSLYFGIAAAVVAITTVGFGFALIDPPAAVREQRLDVKQVSDLQEIQFRIENYYQTNGTLPASLEDLSGDVTPVAPTGRAAYEYQVTEPGYELCATFVRPSSVNSYTPFDWSHKEGKACFVRKPMSNEQGTLKPLR